MKKKTYLVVLALCTALAITACGTSADNKGETKSTAETQDTADKTDSAESGSDSDKNSKDTASGDTRLVSVDDVSKYITIGQYKGLTLDNSVEAVTDDMVDGRVQEELQNKAEEVTEGTVQNGDIVTINYVGTKDGVAFDGGTANNYELTIGSGTFIDGFEDGIIGMKKGQTKDLDLTFPEEYSSEELAGQEVVFKVTLQSFKRAPELTDDWAAKNTDCKTAEDYKKEIRKTLEEEAKTSAQNTLRETAWNTVLSASEVKEYPQDDLDTAKTEFKTLYENYAKQGDKSYNVKDIAALVDKYGQAAVDESIGLLRVEDFIIDNATVEEKVTAGDTQGVDGDDPSVDGSSAEGTVDEELETAEATDMVPEEEPTEEADSASDASAE